MKPESKRRAGPLIRAVALLQVKLLIGAGRDLLLSPISLAAAFIDLVRIKRHEPQFFRTTLKVGEHTDDWIDLWSHARDDDEPRENVDKLLARVEEVVRDPQTGARRARVLKRWAERQIARAKKRAADRNSSGATIASSDSKSNASPDA